MAEENKAGTPEAPSNGWKAAFARRAVFVLLIAGAA